jgi:hypothetical protein
MSIDRILLFFSNMYYIPPLLVYIGNILIVRMGIFSKRKGNNNKEK